MYQKYSIVCFSLLLGGCSTLSADDGFDDAISEVNQKYNYVSIVAKKITPEDVTVGGSNTLKNTTYITANYAKNDKKTPTSFAKVQLSYFKNYDEFTHVTFDGADYPIEAYKVSSTSCTEHCSVTQYFTFPLDNNTIDNSAKTGFVYTVQTANNSNKLSFSIPSGYFQAIKNEQSMYLDIEQQYQAMHKTDSKPVEMSKYWFDEATAAEQEQFTEWAFANRKSISTQLKSDSKSVEMLSYWYEKASTEDRAQILTWLLNK
ncbi:hypothetical protein GNP89_07715 [Aliivibrio fischeri]|uniref:hypothetical protein n=1 Tax=Aliivibrio fischeri TaxID=668 RepID=UPI0012D9A8B0|nr:hypothetical protein [Aliivibrio fischeri]MUL02090.1 hypothetical protein [Aliivibrio fischeri]